MSDRRCACAPGGAFGPSSAPPPASSPQAMPVTEAAAEPGLGGALLALLAEGPGGGGRSAPPTVGEILAALAPYSRRSWTAEQYRAVLAVLEACGITREVHFGGAAPRRHFRGAQGDTLRGQGDGSLRKATVLRPKVTLSAPK